MLQVMTYPHMALPSAARAPMVLDLDVGTTRHHQDLNTPDYSAHKVSATNHGWDNNAAASSPLRAVPTQLRELSTSAGSVMDTSVEVLAEVSKIHPAAVTKVTSPCDEVEDDEEPMIVSEEDEDDEDDYEEEGDDHDDVDGYEEENMDERVESRKKTEREDAVHVLETESESEILSVDVESRLVPLPESPPPAASPHVTDSSSFVPLLETADDDENISVLPPVSDNAASLEPQMPTESVSSHRINKKAGESAVDCGAEEGSGDEAVMSSEEDSAKNAVDSGCPPVPHDEKDSSSTVAQVVEEFH